MNKQSQSLLVALSVALLAGCNGANMQTNLNPAQTPDPKTPAATTATGTATATDAAATATATGTATDSTATATATDSATTTGTGTATDSATATTTGKPDVETRTLPDGQKEISISMKDLPNETVICTVGGAPLRISTYKSMLVLQQVQASSGIGADPAVRAKLLAEAKARNLTLSPSDKEKLLKTAKEGQSKEPGGFEKFLKDRGLTEAQYAEEIYNIGLAYKMSSVLLQQGLLPELVNREILCNAAKAGGLEKDAMNKYFLFKHSRSYPLVLQQTGLPQDALKDEIVKTEMAKLQAEKVTKGSKVTDAELKAVYAKNKELFKHGERVRLSSILILAPSADVPPAIRSIKTEIKNQNPKLTDAEVDARVALVNKELEQKALVILGKAQATKDFGKLANESTDDMQAKMRGTGGELGWLDKESLTPAVADAVWTQPTGTVLPRLIKTELGYQIIKVTGHEKPGYLSFNDVKPIVALQVQQLKTQLVLEKWLQDKHKTTKIEYSPKFLAIANGGKAK
ncbi:MAG: peptidylprolyl isomerase [Candidatus Obscuribacterales bacterium]